MERRHFAVAAIVALAAITLCTPDARALGFTGVGAKLGYASPERFDGTTEVGVHAELAERGSPVSVLPNFRYWSVNSYRNANPNLDVCYRFTPAGRMTPYVGSGVGLNFLDGERFGDSETRVGMNLIGGVRFPGAASYFLEARHTLSDLNQTSLLAGVTFGAR